MYTLPKVATSPPHGERTDVYICWDSNPQRDADLVHLSLIEKGTAEEVTTVQSNISK